jgi:hypothetical protein
LQFIDSLDQNGVYVSLLNDEETPGNSYYYGTDAEGVKGWHAIVDNIGLTCETLPDCATIISILEDIEALQTDVALKANTADLGATAFSNDYEDLDNLPTIPAAQIQSDWTQANNAALDFIKNKPTIPAAQVNSDWNATSGVAQILNKPTIPSIAGLVPETRTLTINGTTQDLSANRTFTIATGLTVGTTPITSGTVGRVLFEGTGNVLQQSGSLFWDNTNSRLGIGTASPTASSHIRGAGTSSSTTTLLVQNSAGTSMLQLRDDNYQLVGNWLAIESSRYLYRALNASGIFTICNDSTIGAFVNLYGSSHATLANVLDLGTASTSRLRIAANGNVLIGTTTDAGFKLDVNGTARVGATASSGQLYVKGAAGTGQYLYLDNGGADLWTLIGGNIFVIDRGGTRIFRANSNAQVTINGSAVDTSAQLQVDSTTRGFLPPRMTTTQKNAIASPAAGLVVYDTTLGKLCVRTASSWETITSI